MVTCRPEYAHLVIEGAKRLYHVLTLFSYFHRDLRRNLNAKAAVGEKNETVLD